MKIMITVKLLFLALLTLALASCSAVNAEPKDISGSWNYTSDTYSFEAEVDEASINIYLVIDGTSGLYWSGDISSEMAEGQTYSSTAQKDLLDASLYGSGDAKKTFTLKDGKIQFEFSIMGTNATIQLQRV